MSRTPDWNVTILNKANEERGKVGVAWNNEDGSIGIVLNPCVVLQASPDLVITLFKRDKGIFRGRPQTNEERQASDQFFKEQFEKKENKP